MMRSLSSGVAGLRTHQTKMDVIGNNIANVNTYGFKASRTTFADVYYQNLAGASAGTSGGVQGGKNATQIGYGASVATIDVQNSVSGAATTDFAMDVYIQGDGFIVSKDPSGRTSYTRLGKLDFDSAGNLVDGNGNVIQGFPMGENGKPQIGADGRISASDLRAITGDPELLHRLTGITISPSGLIVGSLEGDKVFTAATSLPAGLDRDSFSINTDSNFEGDVKLSVGAMPKNSELEAALKGTGAKAFTVSDLNFGDIGLPSSAAPSNSKYTMTLDGTKITLKITGSANKDDDQTYEGIVQEDGSVVLKSKDNNKTAMTFTVSPKPITGDSNGSTEATPEILGGMDTLKYQVTTRDKGDNIRKIPEFPQTFPDTVGKFTLNDLQGITIGFNFDDPDALAKFKPFSTSVGTAVPGDDIMYTIGNLVLAKFPNPNGMKEDGNSYFSQTANSGDPEFVKPGVDGTGAMKAGYLEMSNVDVSKEFTDMITTQRGFQANSRIITVSDTMLEELVNLKR